MSITVGHVVAEAADETIGSSSSLVENSSLIGNFSLVNNTLKPDSDFTVGNTVLNNASLIDRNNWLVKGAATFEDATSGKVNLINYQKNQVSGLINKNAIDLTKDFTFSTEITQSSVITGAFKGIIMTPDGATDVVAGQVDSGLGLEGLKNSVFLGRDLFNNTNTDTYYNGLTNRQAMLIQKTDSDGKREVLQSGTTNVKAHPVSTTETMSFTWKATTVSTYKTTGELTLTINNGSSTQSITRTMTLMNKMFFGIVGDGGGGASFIVDVDLSKVTGSGTKKTATARVKYQFKKQDGSLVAGFFGGDSIVTAPIGDTLGVSENGDTSDWVFTSPTFQGYHVVSANNAVVVGEVPIKARAAQRPQTRIDWGGSLYNTYVYKNKNTGKWETGDATTRDKDYDPGSGFGGNKGYKTLQTAFSDAKIELETFINGPLYASQSTAFKKKCDDLLIRIKGDIGNPSAYTSGHYINSIFAWFDIESELDDITNPPVTPENVMTLVYAQDAQLIRITEVADASTPSAVIKPVVEVAGFTDDAFSQTFTAEANHYYNKVAIENALKTGTSGLTATFSNGNRTVTLKGKFDKTSNGALPADQDSVVQELVLPVISDIQNAIIVYQDVTTGSELKKDTFSGVTGEDITDKIYDIAANISDYKLKGYVVKTNNFTIGSEKFDTDTKIDQTYLVELIHDTEAIENTKVFEHVVRYTVQDGLVSAPADYTKMASVIRQHFEDKVTRTEVTSNFSDYPVNGDFKLNPKVASYRADTPSADYTVDPDGTITFGSIKVPVLDRYLAKVTDNRSFHYDNVTSLSKIESFVEYINQGNVQVSSVPDINFGNQIISPKNRGNLYPAVYASDLIVDDNRKDVKDGWHLSVQQTMPFKSADGASVLTNSLFFRATDNGVLTSLEGGDEVVVYDHSSASGSLGVLETIKPTSTWNKTANGAGFYLKDNGKVKAGDYSTVLTWTLETGPSV